MLVLLFILPITVISTTVYFFRFTISGHIPESGFFRFNEVISMIILPLVYAGFGSENKCCVQDEIDTAAFSPGHQLTIGVIILLALIGYFYSSYRKNLAPPLVEAFVNVLVLTGIVLNIVIAFHTGEKSYAIMGNLPVLFLCIIALTKNQRLFLIHTLEQGFTYSGKAERLAYQLLTSKPLVKYSLLLVLCLPVLTVVVCFLLLFGQKPDSLIRAFTDTYRHGFSQWDYKCANVQCGDHYLCSVAANGHKAVVKPVRMGVRNNAPIICNRQLLIANAFEDLIQARLPSIHRWIRRHYDGVGNFIHRYYFLFEIKIVADTVYIFMKPFEWFFLAVLYTFDKYPENRIAKQYLPVSHRRSIDFLPKK